MKPFSADATKLDFKRISSTAAGAKNEDFIDRNSIMTEYWGDSEGKVTYEKQENGTYLILDDGIPMGYTDEKGMKEIIADSETTSSEVSDVDASATSNQTSDSVVYDKTKKSPVEQKMDEIRQESRMSDFEKAAKGYAENKNEPDSQISAGQDKLEYYDDGSYSRTEIASNGETHIMTYDADGKLKELVQTDEKGNYRKTTYGENGQIVNVQEGLESNNTEQSSNSENDVTTTIDNNESPVTSQVTNEVNAKINSNGIQKYEDGSYTATSINENGNTVIDRYDENGIKTNTREIFADGTSVLEETVSDRETQRKKYDAEGNLQELLQIFNKDTFQESYKKTVYGENGQVISQEDGGYSLPDVSNLSELNTNGGSIEQRIGDIETKDTDTNSAGDNQTLTSQLIQDIDAKINSISVEKENAASDLAAATIGEQENVVETISTTENQETKAYKNSGFSSKNMNDNTRNDASKLVTNFDGSTLEQIQNLKQEDGATFGIDVSHYQGDIDWNSVAASGIDYAIIQWGGRSSSGERYVDGDSDDAVRQNVMKAIDAGLDVSLYTWAHPINEAEAAEEAQWTIDFINSLPEEYRNKLSMPIAYDYESFGGRSEGVSAEQHTKNIETFNKVLQEAGYETMTYASRSHYNDRFNGSEVVGNSNYGWVAEYGDTNKYAGNYNMWQYSSDGNVSGINGRVDLNVYYADKGVSGENDSPQLKSDNPSTINDAVSDENSSSQSVIDEVISDVNNSPQLKSDNVSIIDDVASNINAVNEDNNVQSGEQNAEGNLAADSITRLDDGSYIQMGDYEGKAAEYHYYPDGTHTVQVQIDGKLSGTNYLSFDENNNLVKSEVNRSDGVKTFTIYDESGKEVSHLSVLANGLVNNNIPDNIPIKQLEDGSFTYTDIYEGKSALYHYYPDGTHMIKVKGDGNLSSEVYYSFDALGHLGKREEVREDGVKIVTIYGSDGNEFGTQMLLPNGDVLDKLPVDKDGNALAITQLDDGSYTYENVYKDKNALYHYYPDGTHTIAYKGEGEIASNIYLKFSAEGKKISSEEVREDGIRVYKTYDENGKVINKEIVNSEGEKLEELPKTPSEIRYEEYKKALEEKNLSLAELTYKYGDLIAKENSYDLESIYNAFAGLSPSGTIPAEDLAATEFKSVEEFNNHIKNNVHAAGYGTRNAVVAAALSLVADYPIFTGKKLRYSMSSARQASDVEGIQNEDFYLDCSSFAWWALYNGGFNLPSGAVTTPQLGWGLESGAATKEIQGGKPGDFLVYDHGGGAAGHIGVIVGNYDGGYYVAEFKGDAYGAEINKWNYDSISSEYYRLNMDNYYGDASNIDASRK